MVLDLLATTQARMLLCQRVVQVPLKWISDFTTKTYVIMIISLYSTVNELWHPCGVHIGRMFRYVLHVYIVLLRIEAALD